MVPKKPFYIFPKIKPLPQFPCSNGLLFYMDKLLACSILLRSAHMREIRVHCYAHKHAAGKYKHITRAHKAAQGTAKQRSYNTAKLLRAYGHVLRSADLRDADSAADYIVRRRTDA